ncbi:MAG: TrkH family potassium uptake protein [Candidatus Bipolaricaulota bacterium]
MNWNNYLTSILRELGLLVTIVGMMALLSLPVSLFYREYFAFWPFLATTAISFSLGGLLYFPFRHQESSLDVRTSMLIAASGWMLISLAGSLPFIFIAYNLAGNPETPQTILHFLDPLNAFFESVAGFTGTGLTMTVRENLLPRSLQWWRSLTQWVGGVGVIVLALTILTRSGVGSYNLFFSEAREEKIHPSVLSTVRTIWWIISLYTVLSTLALWLSGMPLWDSINHAMTGITTGGFSVQDGSIAFYESPLIEIVLLPVMLFGAISFTFHYQLLTGQLGKLKEDFQTRWLFLFTVVGIGLVTGARFLEAVELEHFRNSAFQFVSAISCTGFQTADIGDWSATGQMMMVGGMIIGGAAGSTAGGIKILRSVLIVKGIFWQIRRIIVSPNKLLQFKFSNRMLTEEEATSQFLSVATVGLLWLILLFGGVVLLDIATPDRFTLSFSLFEVASAQGNVGLSSGITGPGLNPGGKLILIFHMWIGRLEIIPVLFLLASIFKGRLLES